MHLTPRSVLLPLVGSFVLLASGAHGAAQQLPAGFVTEAIGSGWNSPVGLRYLDAQRLLVAERDGRVWYVENDVKRNLVYDIASETLINGDRGLLGIAMPQDFDLSGWLYLLFVVDIQNGGDRAQLAFSRLIRVHTHYEPNGDLVAEPETREYLLGSTWSTGIASCHLSHTIGSLHFLSDGSLVLTTGDNAHYDATDAGTLDPACFLPTRTPLDQDVGAYRSQYDNTLCGKVLRLDPETGRGLADNPFFTGDADDLLSRVYARGLRNPFRTTLLPGSGPREALFISDVGWNTWEEVNVALGGENFGWPCFEGNHPQNDYQNADVHGLCVGTGAEHTRPLVAWHHSQNQVGFRGNCAAALCFYNGDRYPEQYRGRLFFSDYGRNWMRAARLRDDLGMTESISFGREMAGPVDLVAQPGSGDLVYASISNGVFRLKYVGAQLPPTAVAHATPAYGPGDLDVLLSAAGSSDPENQELSYSWDLGDGLSYTQSEFTHAFTGATNTLVHLTVTDTEGLTDSAEVLVSPSNTPPVIDALLTPADGALFVSDQPLNLAALAHDAEDGTPQATWTLDLIHDHHDHPDWATGTGLTTTLTPDSHGPGDNHFRVRFTVTDARGLSDERALEIYDAHSLPQAHLEDVPETHIRVGQTLRPVGHVDFSRGRVSPKQPTLTWDWGDGARDVFANPGHQVDTRPTHVYQRAGTFKLRLIADLEGARSESTAVIEVGPPRPSVAIFAALTNERWVSAEEQQEIVDTLSASLTTRASEVRAFAQGQGETLGGWMDSLETDAIADVLVLLDFVPAPLIEGGFPGSRLERWIDGGNGLVWTGTTPLQVALDDQGMAALTVLGAETFFGAIGTSIVQGTGVQTPSSVGASVVPSLATFRSERALRYDQLGPEWSVARIFAEDADQDSDALELRHVGHGFYAQFLCDPAALPRAAVLSEFLRDKLGRGKSGSASPGIVR